MTLALEKGGRGGDYRFALLTSYTNSRSRCQPVLIIPELISDLGNCPLFPPRVLVSGIAGFVAHSNVNASGTLVSLRRSDPAGPPHHFASIGRLIATSLNRLSGEQIPAVIGGRAGDGARSARRATAGCEEDACIQ